MNITLLSGECTEYIDEYSVLQQKPNRPNHNGFSKISGCSKIQFIIWCSLPIISLLRFNVGS